MKTDFLFSITGGGEVCEIRKTENVSPGLGVTYPAHYQNVSVGEARRLLTRLLMPSPNLPKPKVGGWWEGGLLT